MMAQYQIGDKNYNREYNGLKKTLQLEKFEGRSQNKSRYIKLKYQDVTLRLIQIYSKYMNPFPKVIDDAKSEEQQLLELLKTNPQLMKKYQQQVAKFQALNQSAKPPITSQDYIQKLDNIQQYFDDEGGITIEPSTAFVLKFLEKRTKEKIFVNIVTHEVIDHPEQKLLVDFENQPGLRIPMSMGRVREDHDKSGNICKVVDVVLNPKIVKTAETAPQIMQFTSQIIGNYLLEKYKIAVSDQMIKKVKGMKYKGAKVEIQRVKGRKAPKIEQISEVNEEVKKEMQKKEDQLFNELNQAKKAIRPQFEAMMYHANGQSEQFSLLEFRQKPAYIKITFDLPHLLHSRGIHLEGSDRLLYLFVKGIYEICLKLPFEVGKYKSRFSKKDRKLQVKVYPIQPKRQKAQQEVSSIAKQAPTVELDSDYLYDLV